MSGIQKLCPNPECVNHDPQKLFGDGTDFCPVCGAQLSFVCAKCRKPLPNEVQYTGERLCEECKQDAAHRKERRIRRLTAALAYTGAACLFLTKSGLVRHKWHL